VNQYAIEFPMFAKTELKKNALYAELVKATGTSPRWNFHKYLVDRSGTKVLSFDTRVAPDDPKLTGAIEAFLK
jgi:glutathione peroxidase